MIRDFAGVVLSLAILGTGCVGSDGDTGAEAGASSAMAPWINGTDPYRSDAGDRGGYPGGGYPCGHDYRRRPPRLVDDGTECPPDEPVEDPVAHDPKSSLRGADCPELLAMLQDAAIRQMEAEVEANRLAALRGDGCYDYVDLGPCSYGSDGGSYYADAASEGSSWDSGASDSGGGPTEGPEEYSETNVQVPGVDEADFMKTDGQYIYILADGKLRIVDSWPPEEARVVSTHVVEGGPTALYYGEDRVVVYSALGAPDPYGYGGYGSGRCTYGYDCDFVGDGRDTKISVFDVSERASPRLLRETVFSGSYINSRRIDGAVFTVLHLPVAGMPSVPTWPAGVSTCPDGWSRCGIERAFDDLLESNRATIRRMDLPTWPASVRDTVHTGGVARTTTEPLVGCDHVYVSDLADMRSMLAVVSFDATALDPIGVTSVLGRPGAVYASADALYVASRHASGESGLYFPEADSYGMVTTVHKFALDAELPAATYQATGVAEGGILNQFSLDEFDGRLRIATTSGHVPDPSVHSTLSVMEQTGGDLVVVGQLDDIAPTEDIRAVRFDGPRGFIVTFKKTDPLFALDLADRATASPAAAHRSSRFPTCT